MFSRAMKCDICELVETVDVTDLIAMDIGAFSGWLRIATNEAVQYKWTRYAATKSSIIDAVDVCSLLCARSFLSKIDKDITAIQDAVAAAEASVE